MWYNSNHIEIKNPKEWYNEIADEYKKYHSHLDWFDKGFFQRILPRELTDISIIDLWAGDWRTWKFFEKKNIKKYTACDISEKILKKHPGTKKIEKIVCDLEEKLPFKEDSYELALSFFVLEHIQNIKWLFEEIYRILKDWWQWIIWHFLQRREFVRKKWAKQFKIKLYNYRIQEIEELAKNIWFKIDVFPISEKWVTIWYIIWLQK